MAPQKPSQTPSQKPKTNATESSKRATARRKLALTAPGVRLTGDRLIVELPGNGERKTAGGLLIPATAMPAPKRLVWADVRLVGPDVRAASTGDRVLFLPSSGLEVELDGEDLILLRERDVQAVTPAVEGRNDRVPGQYL